MSGIVVDLKDFNVRTPEQVLRVFFLKYTAAAAEVGLWKAMGVMSGNPEFRTQEVLPPNDAAELFDHLIALVKALESITLDPPEKCPVCGRLETGGGDAAG